MVFIVYMKNTENYYSTITKVLSKLKPKKILFLSKAACEEWLSPSMLKYSDDIHIDYVLIQEDEILNLECGLMEKNKYKFPYHYVSFDEFKNFPLLESYDFIIMDTVHYKEYMDYIFKNIISLCNGYVLLHDTLPQNEKENMTIPRRRNTGAWVGQTFISYYNFWLGNKDTSYNFNDGYVGYGLIDCTNNNININYDDSKIWELDIVRKNSIPHDKFDDIFKKTL